MKDKKTLLQVPEYPLEWPCCIQVKMTWGQTTKPLRDEGKTRSGKGNRSDVL